MRISIAVLLIVAASTAIAAVGRLPESDAASQPTSQAATQPATELKADEITLEELFPEKGLFGPSARATSFSFDGRYGAYLYRPYKERRHGNDLYILDTNTGEVERITKVSVMSKFQADTRKVRDDRIEKAKKAGKTKKGDKGAQEERKDKSDDDDNAAAPLVISPAGRPLPPDDDDENAATTQNTTDTVDSKQQDDEDAARQRGDWVGDKDADDEKAPRYAGVSAYTWSPVAHELLMLSGDDIYRYDVEAKTFTRLTRTKQRERDVQYLPDGAGYTYMQDGALMRVVFGGHIIEQLDPKLDDGERMTGYRLSPDGTRLVFLAQKQGKAPKPPREVKIAQYTDRFMTVKEVQRQVSDDPRTPTDTSVYLYELDGAMREEAKLWKVHTRSATGPRDVDRVPEWSPDSQRVAFCVYEQESRQVQILEADFPPREDKSAEEADEDATSQPTTDQAETGEQLKDEKNDDGDKDDEKKDKEDEEADSEVDESKKGEAEERAARVVYRFLHDGGPNTPYLLMASYLPDGKRIVFLSEQTGFRQLHVLDPIYQATTPLTHGFYEVYPIEVSKDRRWVFATTTRDDPARRHVYRISTETGEITRLGDLDGDYSEAAVSEDGGKLLANYVTYGRLSELVYADDDDDDGGLKFLTDSHPEKAHKYTRAKPEFFTYENRHGHAIHGQMFKPDDFSPEDQRPLLVYVYGGPLGQRKMVVDGSYSSDAYFFAWYMAARHGYVTCTIDPRGTSGYGGLFEKSNFEQVGKPQVEDLVDGVKWFIENHAVDSKRVAIHGWSFGGFQTQMCLYTEPDVFACGIAGAGPTEWENYNSWYSTGTIGDSREGKTDLKKYSLLPLAKNLKSKLLLVHGMEDSNVLYQDTVRVYRELLKANKETLVELFLDPTGGHGLGGEVKRLNRMRKYEEFLLRCVGEGAPAHAPASQPAASQPAESQPTTQPVVSQPATQPTSQPAGR